jgi:hypothetical protein
MPHACQRCRNVDLEPRAAFNPLHLFPADLLPVSSAATHRTLPLVIVLPEPERLRWSRPSNHLEVNMKLLTRFELSRHSTNELRGIIRDLFNILARAEPDSAERRNALASIENVQAELACRTPYYISGP